MPVRCYGCTGEFFSFFVIFSNGTDEFYHRSNNYCLSMHLNRTHVYCIETYKWKSRKNNKLKIEIIWSMFSPRARACAQSPLVFPNPTRGIDHGPALCPPCSQAQKLQPHKLGPWRRRRSRLLLDSWKGEGGRPYGSGYALPLPRTLGGLCKFNFYLSPCLLESVLVVHVFDFVPNSQCWFWFGLNLIFVLLISIWCRATSICFPCISY